MKIRLAIRGYANGVRQFEDRVDVPEDDRGGVVAQAALRHAEALAAHELHMIEIEFLDEPDPNERFFRLGTDPRGMVAPMWIDIPDKTQ